MIGRVFGRLTVVRYTETRGGRQHVFCTCECGDFKEVKTKYLMNGDTQSCGCLKRDVMIKRNTTHSLCGERLHTCWVDMRKRSRNRECCSISPEWSDYLNFKDWALNNGYAQDKVLCREGDTGDYTPENSRWDSKANNTIEAKGFYWKITFSTGENLEVYNLRQYCKDNGYSYSDLLKISTNKRKTSHRGIASVVKLSKLPSSLTRTIGDINEHI